MGSLGKTSSYSSAWTSCASGKPSSAAAYGYALLGKASGSVLGTTCFALGDTKTPERFAINRDLVSTALADFAKGRVFSIPGAQYKAIAGVSRVVPNRILQKFQSIGRR